MNRTIRQLNNARFWQNSALVMALLVLSIFCFYLRIDPLIIYLTLVFISVLLFLVIRRRYAVLAGRRLTHLAAMEMDPELLRTEAEEAIGKTSRSLKSKHTRLYYESSYFGLVGDFKASAAAWEEMPVPKQRQYQDAKTCGMLSILARSGRVEEAKALVLRVLDIREEDAKLINSCNRALGAYYAVLGDSEPAKACLSKVLEHGRYNMERMGAHFDLARLEENEGTINKAIEHYRQAASLGPKTWMGQEAARRADALEAARPAG